MVRCCRHQHGIQHTTTCIVYLGSEEVVLDCTEMNRDRRQLTSNVIRMDRRLLETGQVMPVVNEYRGALRRTYHMAFKKKEHRYVFAEKDSPKLVLQLCCWQLDEPPLGVSAVTLISLELELDP
uniref:Uncharacterized protein n=1 Tax=Timema genevievae TaxID=629358 RepID=A0A7R9JYK9_TIMGE|nr:unnamed protein product [Timema genevievae]